MDAAQVHKWFVDVMGYEDGNNIIRDMMTWYHDASPIDRRVIALEVCNMLFKLAISRPEKDVHLSIYLALRALAKDDMSIKQDGLFREVFFFLVRAKTLQ